MSRFSSSKLGRKLLAAGAGKPIAATLLLTTLLVGSIPSPTPAAEGLAGEAAKKRCKTVVKRIHGHKRKVRVCRKVKPAPKVKNVSLTLDPGRRVSGSLTAAAGGSITTAAASGAKLTLAVPKDALLNDTTVTVTPVASIAGLPRRAKLIAAVQFGPEGLVLAKPAKLTIESAAASAKNVHAIAWVGSGRYTTRWPLQRSATGIDLPVAHFSGAGVYRGPAAGIPRPDSEGTSRPYYQQVVRPKLIAATTNDALAQEAMTTWLGWERAMQLAGVDDDYLATERAEAEKLAKKVIRNALDKAFERCVKDHDVVKQVRKMLEVARAGVLAFPDDFPEDIDDMIDKCARFELDFETVLQGTFSGGDGGSGSFTAHVRVQSLPVKPSSGAQGAATKQIEYLNWSWAHSDDSCSSTANGFKLGEPFAVTRLDLGETTVTMDVSPGKPIEVIHLNCPGGSADADVHTYESYFRAMHTRELIGDGLRIAGWQVPKGALYARKTYEQTRVFGDSDGSVTIDERTTFDLRHMPPQG